MLIDGRSIQAGSVLRADFCVVGTGMGGAAVARKLAAAGRDVLLVEAGGTHEDVEPAVAAEHAGRPFGLPVTRSIQLGGTSNRWHGVCGPLDDIDFERRPWIDQSGWPLAKNHLACFYDEAAVALGVKGTPVFEPARNPIVARKADAIETDRSILDIKLVQVHEPAHCWKATLLDLARQRKLRCVVNAPGLELVARDGGRQISHLVAGASPGTFRIEANVFVVCAGALETPRLLLNSNRNGGLTGRYLLDHPIGHFCKLGFRRPVRAPLYASMPLDGRVRLMAGFMIRPDQQRASRLPNHYLWMRPSVSPRRIDDELLLSFLAARSARDLTLRQIRAVLTNRDILYRILVHRFGIRPSFRYGDLFFMTEQLPNAESRVRLSGHLRDRWGYPLARVEWALSNADIANFHAYAKLLFGRGLTGAQYRMARVDEPEVWERTVTSAAHHLGSARMGDTPATGVVDANLRVFGSDNLYVCDGSVFPTAGSVNPSFTIVALGFRLATHLLAKS